MKQLSYFALTSVILLLALSKSGAESPFQLSFGYEKRYGTLHYQFHNDSSFNTTDLVPHHFIQNYKTNNNWGVIRARYFLRTDLETEIGLTAVRRTSGEDYDTFFQPDGDIVVAGTVGDVLMRSFTFSQRAEIGELKTTKFWIGYRYQRDRSRFQEGIGFTQHSKPASLVQQMKFVNETTLSRVHEIQWGGIYDWMIGPRLHLSLKGAASPIVLAFLTTILPEKYPGREIVFLSKAFGITGSAALRTTIKNIPLEFYADYGRTRGYQSSSNFVRKTWAIGVLAGFVL